MWLLLALTASLLWGLNYVLAEKAMLRISPLTLMALELFVGAVLATVAALLSGSFRHDLALLARDRGSMLLVGASVVAFTTANTAIFYSVATKNATLAGLVEISYPLFIALFTWLLFRESHLNAAVVAGAALIAAGVTVIMLRG